MNRSAFSLTKKIEILSFGHFNSHQTLGNRMYSKTLVYTIETSLAPGFYDINFCAFSIARLKPEKEPVMVASGTA